MEIVYPLSEPKFTFTSSVLEVSNRGDRKCGTSPFLEIQENLQGLPPGTHAT